MNRLKHRLPLFAAALWWGSLTAVGFLVVPLLFQHLPTARMAGQMAAQLFTAQTWVSVACGVALLLSTRNRPLVGDASRDSALVFIVGGLLLALVLEFGVAPRIRLRENLPLWHGVGSVLYGLQWLCAALSLWRLGAPRQEQ